MKIVAVPARLAPKLHSSGRAAVPVHRQTGMHTVELVGVPCLVGVTLDIDKLLSRIGEKALRSKGKRATAFHGSLILQVAELPPEDVGG